MCLFLPPSSLRCFGLKGVRAGETRDLTFVYLKLVNAGQCVIGHVSNLHDPRDSALLGDGNIKWLYQRNK